MKTLFIDIKNRFGNAQITTTNPTIIEVQFKKSKEPVIIEKGEQLNRYNVSYLKLMVHHNGKRRTEYATSYNMLNEGVFWILKQVQKNGKVMPEF